MRTFANSGAPSCSQKPMLTSKSASRRPCEPSTSANARLSARSSACCSGSPNNRAFTPLTAGAANSFATWDRTDLDMADITEAGSTAEECSEHRPTRLDQQELPWIRRRWRLRPAGQGSEPDGRGGRCRGRYRRRLDASRNGGDSGGPVPDRLRRRTRCRHDLQWARPQCLSTADHPGGHGSADRPGYGCAPRPGVDNARSARSGRTRPLKPEDARQYRRDATSADRPAA